METQSPRSSLRPHWTGGEVAKISLTGCGLYLAIYVLGLSLIFFISLAQADPRGTKSFDYPFLGVFSSIILEIVALLVAIYYHAVRHRGWRVVGLKAISWRWWVTAMVIGVVFLFANGYISLGLQRFFYPRSLVDFSTNITQNSVLLPTRPSAVEAILMILLVGIAVPFAEELFFRGVLYKWIRSRWRVWSAIGASSAIFGVIHGEITLIIVAFILGVINALLFELSGSLWPAIVVHIVNNVVKVASLYLIVSLT